MHRRAAQAQRRPVTAVDLFAGCGGWDIAARQLGIDPLGVEWNADACATRDAAGLRTLQADIDELDPADFAPCEGLIASPPCQDFSVAGKGAGRDGDRGRLVDVVPLWVDALRPRWVACEQVPPVLPIWQEFAHRFRSWGYSTWAGILSAEEFGVPQTRKRAILMASLDRAVTPPAPTYQAYRHGVPAEEVHGLFGTLAPWVSMAEALGWDDGMALRQWRGKGMTARHGDRPDRDAAEPAFAVTGADQRQLRGGAPKNATVRPDTAPAPAPAPTILGNVGKNNGWQWERPATTIAGDPRCFPPGGHMANDGRNNAEMVGRSENAIRLTLPEGLILQGFPPDWPVQGTKTTQWLQVGNAIPPPLARAILGQLVRP